VKMGSAQKSRFGCGCGGLLVLLRQGT
jgi:hypothetical protein